MTTGSAARARLAGKQVIVAVTLRQLKGPEAVMMVQAAGFDGLVIDREHGRYDLEAVAALCAGALALSIPSFVRTGSDSPQEIAATLDAGAQGLIIPHLESAEQTRACVAQAKYPPMGRRSFSALAPATFYKAEPSATSIARQNAQGLVFGLIESANGLAAVREIADVNGLDGLVVGTADLALDLGAAMRVQDPTIAAALTACAAACHDAGKWFGALLPLGDDAGIDMCLALGAKLLLAGIDTQLFIGAGERVTRDLRARLNR